MITILETTDRGLLPPSTSRWRLFILLFVFGLLGILSLLQMPIQLPEGVDTSLSLDALRWIGLAQSALLLAIAVLIGLFAAPKVGLTVPVAEAFVAGRPWWSQLRRQLWPAVVGAALGALILLLYRLLQPIIMPEVLIASRDGDLPLLTRILYGGITEELLLRWGVMSLLVWLFWRVVQRGRGVPHDSIVWGGNVCAAVLFGLGHLPALATFGVAYTTPIILAVVLGNALAGILFGWLYWRHGLEAAILAHAGTHVITVLITLPLLSLL